MLSSILSLFVLGTPGATISGECWSPRETVPCTFVRYTSGRVFVRTADETFGFRSVFGRTTVVSVGESNYTDQCVVGDDYLNCFKTFTFIGK